tara:strand:+ start:327 stop:1529 length:1203 start_codon:yes stop_codon:yes gene_type:complete
MSKKLDKSLMDAYLSVYEDKRGHAAGSSDAEKQASQLASDVRYKAKGKVPEGASKEEKRKIFLQILNASPAPAVVKQMAKEKLLGEQYLPEEEYDRYRDEKLMRGGDHRSKETKERSYSRSEDDDKRKGDTPMQKEFKKKYGKKATALDAVKQDIEKKYGKDAIMKNESYKSGKEVARRNSDDIKKFMQMGKDAPKNEKLNKARGEGPDAYRKAKLDSGTKAGKSNLLKGIEKAKRPTGGKLGMTSVRAAGGVGAGLVAANALRNMVKQDESYVIEDAKMKRQSDEDLKKAHDKFSSMNSSPANDFMKKRIEKEMKRRKKSVSEGNKLNRAIKEVQKTASVTPKPKKKRQDLGDDGTSNTEYNESAMSPVELAIAKKRGRVREGFSAWRTDIRFNEQLKK